MEDQQLTTSSVISFAETLEDESSAFYEGLAGQFPAHVEAFRAFSKEGGKSKILVVRTYQETITDMLEACYCFEGLDLRQYARKAALPKGATLANVVKAAIAMEEAASDFYLDVADRSQSLLATIPRAFRKVADTHAKRKTALAALLGGG